MSKYRKTILLSNWICSTYDGTVLILDPKYYPALRKYFQQIKASDDEQVVVDTEATKAVH